MLDHRAPAYGATARSAFSGSTKSVR
jgi:hypothetical protein